MQNKTQTHVEATLWFNELYKREQNNHGNIPWAKLKVNPLLESYLESKKTHQGKALVIGCGLGDDAYALEVAGYDVVAIDVSEAALNIARQRFTKTTISFEKQDIFEMPAKYKSHFDFVFEAFTIQSLPIDFRAKMIESITCTLCSDGHLLVVAHKKERDFRGPPWPLKEEEIHLFKSHDLDEVSFAIHNEDSPISSNKFRALYKK